MAEKIMKIIESIEMADTDNIYEVVFGEKIEVKAKTDTKFEIIIGGEVFDCMNSYITALEEAELYIVDEHLIISGYGTHSGRQFWQLPEKLKEYAIACATEAM